jgi:hypothetical protein
MVYGLKRAIGRRMARLPLGVSPFTFRGAGDPNFRRVRRITMDRPDHFFFEIGGFGDRQTLELSEDGEIVVQPGQANISWFYEGSALLTPDAGKWAAFLAKVDDLHVWNWDPSYFHVDICDGSRWELELALGDKTVKSYGVNKTPETFDQFKEALGELLA